MEEFHGFRSKRTSQHYIPDFFWENLQPPVEIGVFQEKFPIHGRFEWHSPCQDEKASDVNGEDVEGTQTSIDPSPEVGDSMGIQWYNGEKPWIFNRIHLEMGQNPGT